MASHAFSLIALLPPGSVEAEVGKIQQSIFAEHGLVSAVALPPLIPVASLLPGEPPGDLLKTLNARVSAPYRIRLRGTTAWHRGFLYLAVDSGGLWHELRDGSPCDSDEAPTLLPGFEGFFLGCSEADSRLRELIHPAVPETGYTSTRLARMIVEIPGPQDAWWREVSWEIVEEIPLRGRRRS